MSEPMKGQKLKTYGDDVASPGKPRNCPVCDRVYYRTIRHIKGETGVSLCGNYAGDSPAKFVSDPNTSSCHTCLVAWRANKRKNAKKLSRKT